MLNLAFKRRELHGMPYRPRKTDGGGLNIRQRRFVNEYLIDCRATAACVRAGYAPKNAHITASRLLTNAKVARAVADGMAKFASRLEISAERVLREMALCGFYNPADYVEIDSDTGAIRMKGFREMPPDAPRALKSISENRAVREGPNGGATTVFDKVKFEWHDKIAALTRLGEYLRLWNSREGLSLRAPDNELVVKVIHVKDGGGK
jgi:phage terminase small subunit